jgi:signal transduction histidine kinase
METASMPLTLHTAGGDVNAPGLRPDAKPPGDTIPNPPSDPVHAIREAPRPAEHGEARPLEAVRRQEVEAGDREALRRIVDSLTHQCVNALQRGQACLEMLGWRLQDQPDALELVGRLQKAQDDLQRLFDDARAYTAPINLRAEARRLDGVWREAWENLAHRAARKAAVLDEEVGETDLRCQISAPHLMQVFHNLFDNALAAGANPVRVEVRCSPDEVAGRPAVRVAVRDNGPGFTVEQRQRAFDPFYTTKPRRAGLGLTICRRIVEAHGGRIEVTEGRAPGGEVVVWLPRRMP